MTHFGGNLLNEPFTQRFIQQGIQKKQVSVISNIFKSKLVLYFKQVLVINKENLNRKNKKQEKNSFQNLPGKIGKNDKHRPLNKHRPWKNLANIIIQER